ncbi:hypothetical protein PRZ48_002731 [Zasmidium cellare]|uniref:MAPEG family protein n=1 Tax=Zasmidium cellare TaxID=395010 RepID=A0ABR0ET11_ZASCE|nr:hypothetical protein PRZ48_002731 [Zasmidium cellare]
MAVSNTPLVGPVIAMALWTFAMEGWMYSYRLPDISKYNVQMPPTVTQAELEKQIPRHRNWPAENFNHLHEQPTIFYAIALALTFLEVSDGLTISLAWSYVGVRVVHSLIQAKTNIIMNRFAAFATSSVILFGMTVKAAAVYFF